MNEAELYQRRPFTGTGGSGGTTISESTVIATSASQSSGDHQQGRVVRPARRRSRASRRAPTTLLNTDTTNFRAMVQQFTGIPSGPTNYLTPGNFHSSLGQPTPPPPVINFGRYQHASLLQQHQQQQQFQLQSSLQSYNQLFQQNEEQQQQQQLFQLGGGGTTGVNTNPSDDAFLQGFLGNPSSAAHDGFFMDAGGDGSSTRPGSSTDHRSDSYFP